MTRKKVTLAWISNDSARKVSLEKRRLGLMKKMSELTILCGIRACLIIYSPNESEPMVWPSHAEVQRQLEEYWKTSELDRLKKMVNQETYLKERITKAKEQLGKLQRKNNEVEMGHLMHQIEQGKGIGEFNNGELHGLIRLVEEKMDEIQKRIEFFHQLPHGDLTAQTVGGGHKPLMMNQRFTNMVNNNEHTFGDIVAQDHLGLLPGHKLVGNSDVGVPLYGDLRGTTTDMGQQLLGFRPYGDGATEMGLPHGSTIGSNNISGAFGNEIGMGGHPFECIGSSYNVSEQGVAWPLGGDGGDNCGGTSNGIDMQFDGQSWPNNFSA
ncbi:hypothetical protein Gotur_012148 [Gossypium turneri]